jgi:hypothetical protein
MMAVGCRIHKAIIVNPLFYPDEQKKREEYFFLF